MQKTKKLVDLVDLIDILDKRNLKLLFSNVCVEFVENGKLSPETLNDLLKYEVVDSLLSIAPSLL